MDQFNEGILDYFLLPAVELAQTTVGKLTIANQIFDDRQHESLGAFYQWLYDHGVADDGRFRDPGH
jgi:hypothetical protein